MSSDLKERIYQAQCLGNVQPIEHMVPYPNLRALVDTCISLIKTIIETIIDKQQEPKIILATKISFK